jgi:uncharacterized protein YecT (DUF1311 family)
MNQLRQRLTRSSLLCLVVGLAGVAIGKAAPAQEAGVPGDLCRNAGGTSDAVACYNKAYEAADRELNTLYSRLRKVLGREETDDLVKAQRLWVQTRDATCTANYHLYGGGTGGPVARLECLWAETLARTASLNRTYLWVLIKRADD